MSGERGHIPPGQGRLSKAACAGLFPVPAPLILGASFLAAYGVLALWGGQAIARVKGLVRQGLELSAASRGEPADHLTAAVLAGLQTSLPLLIVAFSAALIAALVPAWFFRRGKGRTAVPLPPPPGTGPAIAVFRSAGLVLFCLLALSILRNNAIAVPRLIDGHMGAATHLGVIIKQLLAAVGVVAVLVGVIELVYTRARVWRSLHLTSSEANREARAAGGDRAIKSERRRRAAGGASSET